MEVHLSPTDSNTPAGQAAALTAISAGARCFLGGVELTGDVNQELVLPFKYKTIGEAAIALGARNNVKSQLKVIIGNSSSANSGWVIKAWWNGWIAGCKTKNDSTPCGNGRNVLAGIAAGNIAVSEAFQQALGNPRAGLKSKSISLWNPVNPTDSGETNVYLPHSIWFIGLGNLGQSYMWSMLLLPFNTPSKLKVVLQDYDLVQPPNLGTSILTAKKDFGRRKSDLVGEWASMRGFDVARYDRRFDDSFRRQQDEPAIAITGLDSMKVRMLLGNAGFDYVIDAGLGDSAQSYHTFRLNVFYDEFSPQEHFKDMQDDGSNKVKMKLSSPEYQRELTGNPEKDCGVAQIAGASVAAPFVSGLVGALTIAQAIRIASGKNPFKSVSGSIFQDPIVFATEGEKPKAKYPGYSDEMAC